MLIINNNIVESLSAPITDAEKALELLLGKLVLDEEHGDPFIDSTGTTYFLRKRTLAEIQTALTLSHKARQERQRITTQIPDVQELTLDQNGTAVLSHNIKSLWYAVFVTPLDEAMPNVYVHKDTMQCLIAGGTAYGKVMCRFDMLIPTQDDHIFLNP